MLFPPGIVLDHWHPQHQGDQAVHSTDSYCIQRLRLRLSSGIDHPPWLSFHAQICTQELAPHSAISNFQTVVSDPTGILDRLQR